MYWAVSLRDGGVCAFLVPASLLSLPGKAVEGEGTVGPVVWHFWETEL